MDFNTNKCHVMEMGKSERRTRWTYKRGNAALLKKVREENDLGVIMQDRSAVAQAVVRLTAVQQVASSILVLTGWDFSGQLPTPRLTQP